MKLFSGIQPTGNLHIGNYLGALKKWKQLQDKYSSIFCIVDYHAITVDHDPEKLKEDIYKTAALYLATGIDPEKSTIFLQSQVSTHTELAWILSCHIPMGWMERMTQFKQKTKQGKSRASVGLFSYPSLMAADILLYQTDIVPVGEDQKQHIELTRDIAKKFNNKYGDIFKLPEAIIPETGARILDLQNSEKKMSKSSESKKGTIFLLDSPETIREKIMKATTDSKREIKFDKNRKEIYNLLTIYKAFSNKNEQEIEKKFKDKGYGDFKKELGDLVVKKLSPFQKKYKEMINNPSKIESILEKGRKQAKEISEKNLKNIKDKIGTI